MSTQQIQGGGKKYLAFWSGGKDSTATIILAHLHNEPIDEIVYVEVMFDSNLSGEFPEHIDFIKNIAIPKFKEWGYSVQVLRSDKTFMDIFTHYPTRGKYKDKGLRGGFPLALGCEVNGECKRRPINQYLKGIDEEVVQYVGIAIDESNRLQKLDKHKDKTSLLAKYNYTEEQAKELCIEYGLLSPIYRVAHRNGCWFCPNARIKESRYLWTTYPNLWGKLMWLEEQPNLIRPKWKGPSSVTAHQLDERFKKEVKS